MNSWEQIVIDFYAKSLKSLNLYLPKIIGAIIVLVLGLIIAYLSYKFVIFLFKKFRLIKLIDKIEDKMDLKLSKDKKSSSEDKPLKKEEKKKLTEKIKVDVISAKALAYYIFLIFFRYSIVVIGINDIEKFLSDVLVYIPNLFIAVLIGYFGLNFSDTVYDVVYYTLKITKHQTSKIIAMGAKIIVLFFTIMIVLNYAKIVDEFIINAIFVGFISTVTIGVGISFGLGGKHVAREILESFKNN